MFAALIFSACSTPEKKETINMEKVTIEIQVVNRLTVIQDLVSLERAEHLAIDPDQVIWRHGEHVLAC